VFVIEPLSPIGAELHALDLRELDDEMFPRLRAALLEHGVLVLRGQTLDDARHVALARRFGVLEALGRETGAQHPELIPISNRAPDGRVLPRSDAAMLGLAVNEQWHTDSSFRKVPSTVSVFRAEVVPAEGGDTCYASLRAGWLALSEREQAELEPLRLVHDYARSWDRLGASPPGGFQNPPVTHPLVRRHPETGERGLYLSDHAYAVEGWPAAEGRALIERLLALCTRPDCVYRHRWRKGDVLIWDNRNMLHRAQGFDDAHLRVMFHVRVAGERFSRSEG
jgi:alpha-ketoglutarate-dependent 2,4-dichlorophenoxyacetate dioxygenase